MLGAGLAALVVVVGAIEICVLGVGLAAGVQAAATAAAATARMTRSFFIRPSR